MSGSFPSHLETLCDLPDDLIWGGSGAWDGTVVRSFAAKLASLGFLRMGVSWYGRSPDAWMFPSVRVGASDFPAYEATLRQLGDIYAALVEAGHQSGMEVFAQFKPYENGGMDYGGSDQIWSSRFLQEHKDLVIRRIRPDSPTGDLARLLLLRSDCDAPMPHPDGVKIWAGSNETGYEQLTNGFRVREVKHRLAAGVADYWGTQTVEAGQECQGLEIEFDAAWPDCLAVIIEGDGNAAFSFVPLGMILAFDGSGTKIPGSLACINTTLRRGETGPHSFLLFDNGFGAMPYDLCAHYFDRPAFIGWQRGRRQIAPGLLSESEPAVREHWLREVDDILDAGFDGIDFRIENHALLCDDPDAFGRSPTLAEVPDSEIARVRGDNLDKFVRELSRKVRAAGRKLRIVYHTDLYGPEPLASRRLAGAGAIEFHWRNWLQSGLADEVLLFSYDLPFDRQIGADVEEVLGICREQKLPIVLNRYVDMSQSLLGDTRLMQTRRPEISGIVLYETATYLRWDADAGEFRITNDTVKSFLQPSRPPSES